MNIKNTQIPYTGSTSLVRSSELVIEYKFTKTILSNDMVNARNSYLKSLTSDEKNINNCLKKVVSKLIENGIDKAEKLVDIHPGYEEMDNVIFRFLTNSEVIAIAEYYKKDRTLHFDKSGIANALKSYLDDECDEYL